MTNDCIQEGERQYKGSPWELETFAKKKIVGVHIPLVQPGCILTSSPHLPPFSLSPDYTSVKAGTGFIASWYSPHGDVFAILFIRLLNLN